VEVSYDLVWSDEGRVRLGDLMSRYYCVFHTSHSEISLRNILEQEEEEAGDKIDERRKMRQLCQPELRTPDLLVRPPSSRRSILLPLASSFLERDDVALYDHMVLACFGQTDGSFLSSTTTSPSRFIYSSINSNSTMSASNMTNEPNKTTGQTNSLLGACPFLLFIISLGSPSGRFLISSDFVFFLSPSALLLLVLLPLVLLASRLGS
jgi:hypothetical protein